MFVSCSAFLMTEAAPALPLENVCYRGDLCFFFFPLPQAVLTVSFILAKITNECAFIFM